MALNGRMELGAEYFPRKDDSLQTIEHHLQMMKEHGLHSLRVFALWDDVQPQPDLWVWDVYDDIFDAANRIGLSILLTLCCEDPPGWRRLTPYYHHRSNLNDPTIRGYAAEYLERVVSRYFQHPALRAWSLMNEPSLDYQFEASTQLRFQTWLTERYGDAGAIRAADQYFLHPNTFSEMTVAEGQWQTFWSDYRAFIDWKDFCIANLCDHLAWIRDVVTGIDPHHPTHINVHGLTGNMPASGQDVWAEGHVVDEVGASIHPSWNFTMLSRADFGALFGYAVDLTRSGAMGKPWWVTELQGGPTVFTGGRALNPSSEELTRWLWDSVGAGAEGVVFWMWHGREQGREGGEWGLLQWNGRPSERLAAVQAVATVLDEYAPIFASARSQAARIAILYDRHMLLLNAMDAWSHNLRGAPRDLEGMQSILGCYRVLHRNHQAVDFIAPEQLLDLTTLPYRLIYVPYGYVLSEATITALKTYVAQGGTVWADGLIGWKDPWGAVRNGVPGGVLREVFGVEVEDIAPYWPDVATEDDDSAADTLWELSLSLQGASAAVHDASGRTLATRHRYGQGTAWFGVGAISLASLRHPSGVYETALLAPLKDLGRAMHPSVAVIAGDPSVAFRGMTGPHGDLAVLNNWSSNDCTISVQFQGAPTHIDALLGSATYPVVDGDDHTRVVEVRLGPQQSEILHARP